MRRAASKNNLVSHRLRRISFRRFIINCRLIVSRIRRDVARACRGADPAIKQLAEFIRQGHGKGAAPGEGHGADGRHLLQSLFWRLRGGAGRTRTSDQTIISRYSERGLRARNLRRPRCSNALRRKAEHLVLPAPFRRQIGEASDTHAMRQPAIDGRFDEIGCEESKRYRHVDLSCTAVFPVGDAVGSRGSPRAEEFHDPSCRCLPPRDLECAWWRGKMDDRPVHLDLNARDMSTDKTPVADGLRGFEMVPNRFNDQSFGGSCRYAAH